MEPHLNYIERGIRSQDAPDKLERLTILENFRAQAQQWIERRELSYRRWINLNYRLSILATPRNKRIGPIKNHDDFFIKLYDSEDWITDVRLESFYSERQKNGKEVTPIVEMLNKFPEVIIAPQIDGIMGIMPLTRMSAQRVYLHALENKASRIHNELRYPDWIFWHEGFHMNLHETTSTEWSRYHKRPYEEIALPFHNAFFLHIQKLPKKEQEILEFVYHYIVFEKPYDGYSVFVNFYGYSMFSNTKVPRYPNTLNLREYINNWSEDLSNEREKFPDWVQPNNADDIKAFLIDAMDLYDNTAREVFNGL